MARQQADVFLISMAAEMLDMHPQTLRKYERLGLVRPLRTRSMRLYTQSELDRLRMIKTLVEGAGINLAGVQRLLSIADVAERLRPLADGRIGRTETRQRLAEALRDLERLLGLDGER